MSSFFIDLAGKLYPERAYRDQQLNVPENHSNESSIGFIGRIGSALSESSIIESFNKTKEELTSEANTLVGKIVVNRLRSKTNKETLSKLDDLKKKIDYFVFNASVFQNVSGHEHNFHLELLNQQLNEVKDLIPNWTTIVFDDGTILEVDSKMVKEQALELFNIFGQHFTTNNDIPSVIELEGRSKESIYWTFLYLGINSRDSLPETPQVVPQSPASVTMQASKRIKFEEETIIERRVPENVLQIESSPQHALILSTHKRMLTDEPQQPKRVKITSKSEVSQDDSKDVSGHDISEKNTQRLKAIKELTRINPKLIIELLRVKDTHGETLLDDVENLKVFLPLLLDTLSEENLVRVLFLKTSKRDFLLHTLTEDVLGSLSKSQCLRLCNYFSKHPSAENEKLPTFIKNYIEIIQQYPLVRDDTDTADKNIVESAAEKIMGLADLTEDEKYATLANYIDYNKIPLRYLENYLIQENLLSLGKHLRHFDLKEFGDTSLARNLIQNSPHLQCLELSNSYIPENDILEGINELPLCEEIELTDYVTLIRLPALPLCKSFMLNGCYNVTSLPALPLCEEFYSIFNEKIATLQALPLCTHFESEGWTNLTSIHALPLCETLKLNECDKLTSLPALPSCKRLICKDCISLTGLPPLPLCEYLDYRDCPRIQEIPELPYHAQVYSSTEYTRMKVDIEKFSTEPVTLLLELGKYLHRAKPFPNVCYFEAGIPSIAIDVGGVRRDFISQLCKNLFKENIEPDEQGKFLLRKDGLPCINNRNDIEIRAYLTLGAIFAVCYQSTLKTGPLFSDLFYQCLSSIGDAEDSNQSSVLKRDMNCFLRLTVGDSFPNLIRFFNDEIQFEDLSQNERDNLAMLLDLESASMITVDHFKDEKQMGLYRKALVEKMNDDESLDSILCIGTIMKKKLGNEVWASIKEAQDSQALRDRVEGILNVKALKDSLQWEFDGDNNDPRFVRIKEYLNTWIDQNSDPERLSLFIRTVTGNMTLTEKKLKMKVFDLQKFRAPTAHTCFYTLELSLNYENQEKFDELLEYLLAETNRGTGFSIA